MPTRLSVCRWGLPLLAGLLLFATSARSDDEQLAAQISELVADLDADTISERDIAESNLLSLAELEGVGAKKFLDLVPKPNDNMPAAVRERLTAIRKTIEERMSRQATEASSVTLEAINWPLADVLKELEKLTGNKIIDNRTQDGVAAANPEVVLKVDEAPFWSAIDQVLDQANLSPSQFAGEDALALVARDPGESDRFGKASYSGPFRFEVVEVGATRGLRNPTNQSLNVELEIAWEPRLRPIAITQQLDLIDAKDGEDEPIPVGQPGRVFHIEVQEGTCTSTIRAPLELPDRTVGQIATLKGALQALVPGERAEFRFDNLNSKKPLTQTLGGVHVTLERVTKNNEIWEVHMTFHLDEDNNSLASHRGWVFNNLTFLVGEDGEPIDHAGFETIKQTKNEVGIAYFFDLEGDLDGLTWVYKSPISIIERSYKYELKKIDLP
ncbi:MAG: hypothetical protein ACR2NU_08560 [Aeoliella sp.]